jgi:hypothetical protein
MQPTISREAVMYDRRQPTFRWSAVFAGVAASVGIWMLLQLLGTGIGLAAVDTDDAGSLRGVGIGTTVWSLIAPLIAMFCGGLLTGKLAQTQDRKLGGAHGLVMWAITSIVGLWALLSIVTALGSAVSHAGGVAAQAAGNALSSTANKIDPGEAMDALGVDADDMLGPVNQQLAAQGKPTITAAQLRAATRGVARDAARGGGVDRERLIDQLAANTQLSRADAADVARQVESRWRSVGAKARDLGERAEGYALDAADATGKALATVGLSLLLGLVTAVVGAMIAAHRTRRDGPGAGPGGSERRPAPPQPPASGYMAPDGPGSTPSTSAMGGSTAAPSATYPPTVTAPYPPYPPPVPPRDGSLP